MWTILWRDRHCGRGEIRIAPGSFPATPGHPGPSVAGREPRPARAPSAGAPGGSAARLRAMRDTSARERAPAPTVSSRLSRARARAAMSPQAPCMRAALQGSTHAKQSVQRITLASATGALAMKYVSLAS